MSQEVIAKLRLVNGGTPAGDAANLCAEALAQLLERSGPRKMTPQNMPRHNEHCLIWLKGAEHWTIATVNFNENSRGAREAGTYFLLANTGTTRRYPDEVTHWMPLPPGPHL